MKKEFGYTTGVCTAGATKASLKMLVSQKKISRVTIAIPAGIKVNLKIHDAEFNDSQAVCSIIKHGGRDPDVTDGMKIFAKVKFIIENKILISAGKGIGIVTKKGLAVDVGLAAINPIPMKMIIDKIEKLKPQDRGVKVEISAPNGEKIAKKTFIVEEAFNHIKDEKFFAFIAEKISKKLKEIVKGIEVGVILFTNDKGFLADTLLPDNNFL